MKLFNRKGESLIEVVIALFILVMSGAAITTLFVTSMHSAAISREKFAATSLAKEGVEGVINMVGTNWLRFPTAKGTCWRLYMDENVTKASECMDDLKMAEGKSYVLGWSEQGTAGIYVNKEFFKWRLYPVSNTDFDALDSDASALAEQAYCMKDHDPGGQREGLLYQDPDGVPPENGCKFYREIRVTPVSEEGKDKSMEVESKVGWFHSGKFRTVILKTDIRNNVY